MDLGPRNAGVSTSRSDATRCDGSGAPVLAGPPPEPLVSLEGLREVDLDLRGVDDGAVGRLSSVESLAMISDCRETLDLSGLQKLRDLSTSDRPWTGLNQL